VKGGSLTVPEKKTDRDKAKGEEHMNLNLFGLNDAEVFSLDEKKAMAKRKLKNLLTSYADEADVFTEIIQNAMDAITQAIDKGLYKDGEERPKLIVVLGRREGETGHHYLYVGDNGIGMSPKTANNISVPDFSFEKVRGQTIGYKGVGASYFFAASEHVALYTVDEEGTTTQYEVRRSYAWIMNEEDPLPVQNEREVAVPEYVRDLLPNERGTGV